MYTVDHVGIVGPHLFGLWSNVSGCFPYFVQISLLSSFQIFVQFHGPHFLLTVKFTELQLTIQAMYAVSENAPL